jgi:hypothetical protein
MSTLVESLKRLYESGRITEEIVMGRLKKGTITQEECDYILSKPKVEEDETVVAEEEVEVVKEETNTEEDENKED